MFILNISNYCDKNDIQLCTYTIIDSANNIICEERASYISSAQKYLKKYFSKDIEIISGKGNVLNTAEIKFKVA